MSKYAYSNNCRPRKTAFQPKENFVFKHKFLKVVLLQKSHNIAPFASKHSGILKKKIKKGGKTLSLIPLPYVGNLHGLGVLQTFTFVTRGP